MPKKIRLDRELYEKVEARAKKEGKTPEQIVADAVLSMAREYGITN